MQRYILFFIFSTFSVVLLFLRRWYSSCACFMPLSPVTVPAVTKGSSNQSLVEAGDISRSQQLSLAPSRSGRGWRFG